MRTPLVTVITTVRNDPHYLPQAIESIRAQTITDWEYLIVDDASDDQTPDVLAKAAAAEPRIRVITRTEPGRPYVAANDALDQARGRYIARLDADDISPPRRLERQLGYLASRPRARACGGHTRMISGDNSILPETYTPPSSPRVLRWWLGIQGGPTHSTLLAELNAMREIGGYRPLPYAQDFRLWTELSQRGWLVVCPEILAFWRTHPHQITNTNNYEQAEYAIDAAVDHLNAISLETWSRPEVSALWAVSIRDVSAPEVSLRALRRWERLWRTDKSLKHEDRLQLGTITKQRRKRFLLSTINRHRAGVLRMAPRLLLDFFR